MVCSEWLANDVQGRKRNRDVIILNSRQVLHYNDRGAVPLDEEYNIPPIYVCLQEVYGNVYESSAAIWDKGTLI